MSVKKISGAGSASHTWMCFTNAAYRKYEWRDGRSVDLYFYGFGRMKSSWAKINQEYEWLPEPESLNRRLMQFAYLWTLKGLLFKSLWTNVSPKERSRFTKRVVLFRGKNSATGWVGSGSCSPSKK